MALEFNGTNIEDLKINNVDAYDVFFNDVSVLDNNYLRSLNLLNSDGIEVTSRTYTFEDNIDWYMQMELDVPNSIPPASQVLMGVGSLTSVTDYRCYLYTSGGASLIWRNSALTTLNIANFFTDYAGQRVTIKASLDSIGYKFFINGVKVLDAPTAPIFAFDPG